MKRTKQTKSRRAILCAMVTGTLMLQMPVAVYAAEEEPAYQEQVVVTANRMPTKMSEAAANVTVITGEQIENGHYQNLGEVLRNVNGLTVNSKAFPGAQETLRINGDDRVLVMIDGRKISRPEGASDYHANVDLTTISLDNIERVEIVKGGASALYGSDAVGGVVNIITRKGKENKISLKTSVGSWGEQKQALGLQGKKGKYSWYVTADREKQDYVEYKALTGGGVKRWPNSAYDSKAMTVRLDKEIDKNRFLTFDFAHFNDKSGQPYSTGWISGDIGRHLWNNWALTYNFKQKTVAPGRIQVYSNYDTLIFQGKYRSRTTGLQYQNGWQVNDKNILLAGVNWEKGEVLQNTATDGTVNYNDKEVTDMAIYLQDGYRLTPKWTLTPGVRYDHYDKFGGQTTPKIQANYKAGHNTDLYASYNRVFRAPNLDDLYYNNAWSKGNPNLKPETGQVLTFGINHRFNKETTIKVNYFNSKIDNAIYWYTDPVTWSSYKVANANEKKHGFELDMTRRFSDKYYGQIGYSYLHSEVTGTGSENFVNYEPNGYRLQFGYRDEKCKVGIAGVGVGGREAAKFVNSSYWIWNININYKFNKKMSGFIKVNNITNEAYQILANANGNYPMPARSYQLGVGYQF